MKKLPVTFAGTTDTTGYLFSFAKSLSAALRCSRFADFADDAVAASGFAFRMWVDGGSLCPSATSIWAFKKQKPWVENAGLVCDYVERLWGQDALEAERREAAIAMIRRSIDDGVAAVAWDISGSEWGLVVGYDDETETLATLKINGREDSVPYAKLGQLDLPILSVLTVTGSVPKSPEQLVADTKRLAVGHLRGKEWCDNAKGLAAYDALIGYIREKLTDEQGWNLQYYLGTYAALKWYAARFFAKYGEAELAVLYEDVYGAWKQAFDFSRAGKIDCAQIAAQLETAQAAETRAAEEMER